MPLIITNGVGEMKKRCEDMPMAQQTRYKAEGSDLKTTTAIPYWQPVLENGERRKAKEQPDGDNLAQPHGLTFSATNRQGD